MPSPEKVHLPDAGITDEMVNEMRGKIGLKLRIEYNINNDVATRIAIRKFADGIGDGNPLWQDEEYAGHTRYGTIVAPPAWVFTVFNQVMFGWRGLGGFHAGSDDEFYEPVLMGDKITAECIYKGFDGPMPSEFAGRMVIDRYENNYRNQKDKLVARMKWWVVRVEKAKAREASKYGGIKLPHPWSKQELEELEAQMLRETPRGSNVRYWEDVTAGEQFQITKGPYGFADMMAYTVGGGESLRHPAFAVKLREFKRHPAWWFRDPNTCALEPIATVHYDIGAARAMGLPYPYDTGIQRHCFLTHLLTDWMGDEGWLKRAYAEYRKFVYYSDVLRLTGKVTEKYRDDDGECCVRIETAAVNQRGENVMPGHATVALPSRDPGTWPVARRLPT